MQTIHWQQAEVLELEHTDEYIGVIEMQSTELGLRCDVKLEDVHSDSSLLIATCLSKEYNIQELHDYAESVLQDEEYCESAWKHNCEIR